MSLKAFHLVFITASTLLSFGFGAWSLRKFFSPNGVALDFVAGFVAVILGVGLIWYGKYFLKKLKRISYL